MRFPEAMQKFQKAQTMKVTGRARSRVQTESTKSLCIEVIQFSFRCSRAGPVGSRRGGKRPNPNQR